MKRILNCCLVVIITFFLACSKEKFDLAQVLEKDCSHIIVEILHPDKDGKYANPDVNNPTTVFFLNDRYTRADVSKLVLDNQRKLHTSVVSSTFVSSWVYMYDQKKSMILLFFLDDSITAELIDVLKKASVLPVGESHLGDRGIVFPSTVAVPREYPVALGYKVIESEFIKMMRHKSGGRGRSESAD